MRSIASDMAFALSARNGIWGSEGGISRSLGSSNVTVWIHATRVWSGVAITVKRLYGTPDRITRVKARTGPERV
jgi:hypothetical protein